jgi:hypothetical protein
MIRPVSSITLVAILVVGAAPVSASPIFTFSQPPGASAAFNFATSVSDFTTPYTATGAGSETAVLGAPDGGSNPNTQQYVDFGGGNRAEPWAVTLGFATPFGDVAGVDVRIFTTQLNSTEGFDVYASGNGTTFTLIGTFVAFDAGNPGGGSIDIDFNGTVVPAGAQYLRFVGTTVPISGFSFGTDFDAVGVTAAPTPMPEPASLLLLGTGLLGAGVRLWRQKRA